MSDDNLKVRKSHQADYIFWLRKDSWHPAEASILLAGYEPEAFTDGDINFSSLAGDADGIHRLIIESINAKKISVNNPPSQWIAWATQEGMTLPAELMAARPSQTGPGATATPAPVVTASASNRVETAKAGSVDTGWVMKKSALIKKHAAKWGSIEGDLHSASENGLSNAAKAPGRGNWFEAAALNWARQRGKLTEDKQHGPATISTVWTGKTHTISG